MTLRLRVLVAAAIAMLITLGGTISSFAFTPQTGFGATTYATLPSGSAAGVAFIGTTLYVVDPVGDGLYATPLAGSASLVATIPGGPTGLTTVGSSLYATRATSNDVVRIDPLTGVPTVIAVSSDFSDLAVKAIAADASTGDLYVTTSFGYIWVIHPPYLPASAMTFFHLLASASAYGLAVAADHSLFVAVPNAPSNGVWHVASDGSTAGLIATFSGGRGIGVIPGYVYVNNADGSITKFAVPGVGAGAPQTAVTGGLSGDLATIGTDGCFYASQGPTVIRVANVNGTCDLANTTPPPPPPTLTLANVSGFAPIIGDGSQTFNATVGNVATPGGIAVTFTVTRGASTTTSVATTGPNGIASFSYIAATAGTDVVTASAVVNAIPVTSAPVTVVWIQIDHAAPTITYTVTGTHGGTFACPDPALSTPGVDYCGWFTSPPTLHFSVAANGPSGLAPYSCPDFTLTTNSAGTSTTCIARNGDGAQTVLTVYLRLLTTAPTISASAATVSGPYTGGPTKQDVTVTFTCASAPDLGTTTLKSCTAPVTVTAEGLTTVSGQAVNVAGTTTGASFGPILIDKSAPVITASMKTATDGLPYVPNTPTAQDVIVTFTCTDTFDPAPSCPGPVTVSSGTSATATSTDWVGNTATKTFGGIVIDRTGPAVSAAITPLPDVNGNNSLHATVNLTATDTSGIGSITYSASGAQTIAPTTVAGTGTTFSTAVALSAIGDTTVTYSATDALGNATLPRTVTVHILATQPTTLAITSAPSITQGVPVSATLLAFGTAPVAGQTVTFTAGTATATAITDASGTASAVLTLAPGTYTLTASFSGTTAYIASNAGPQTLIVSAPTQFVIWGGNPGGVQVGQRVIFWGEHWWDAVQLTDKQKVKEFKGWADMANGATWSSKGGDSKPPETIATYISVIITNSVTKVDDKDRPKDDKTKVRGNVVGHAILRVDSPYKNEPGKPVYGVVVAVIP
jgi:hypothetical protein